MDKRHVFEHFGPAPYRYLGVTRNMFVPDGCPEAAKPGGSCDHCGTGILWEFHFQAANGRTFKVGSSCVEKSGDNGLRNLIATDVREHQRELRQAREAKKRAKNAAIVASEWPSVRPIFAAQPHPNTYYASQGKTLADYLEFCGHEAIVSRLRKAAQGITVSAAGAQW